MKKTTRMMMVMAATLLTGSVMAQVIPADSTKTDSSSNTPDTTVAPAPTPTPAPAPPVEDKKPEPKDSTAAPQAFRSSLKSLSNTFVMAATNREILQSKKNSIKEMEKEEA